MNPIKAIYCRAVQFVLRAALPVLPYREPEIFRSCAELNTVFAEKNIWRVLIVTDPGIVRSGIAGQLEAALDGCGVAYTVYSETRPNPTVANVEAALNMYHRDGCQALIAIGGGSSMDCAKAVGARIARPRTPLGKLKGTLRILHKLPTLIAIPTTAGTGSETTLAAVITDSEKKHKYVMNDFVLIPRYAVLDASLTRSLPPHLTSTTGMDALTHAVEAYLCWTNRTRESDRLAEEATVAIFRYLERAYQDGDDMQARGEMLIAAYKAGYAFTRAGVGNVHAIAHTLGGLYGTPHGLANAVILPIVLEDYGEKVYPRLARLAELTGLMTQGSDEAKAKAFIAEIYAMNRRMGIPRGFDHIRSEDIPQMVQWALQEANPTYPVPVLYDEQRCTQVIKRIIAQAEQQET